MIELTLITLLDTMAPRFCDYKKQGLGTTKSTLLAYSEMHDKYKSSEIRRVVRDGVGLKEIAVAMVATNCPIEALK